MSKKSAWVVLENVSVIKWLSYDDYQYTMKKRVAFLTDVVNLTNVMSNSGDWTIEPNCTIPNITPGTTGFHLSEREWVKRESKTWGIFAAYWGHKLVVDVDSAKRTLWHAIHKNLSLPLCVIDTIVALMIDLPL
jgi:hypothetical protein